MAQIALIDDDDAVRRSLGRILERADHEVTDFPDGKAAMESLGKRRPDVIITDIYMPEMDGIEFLIRIQDVAPQVPVIAISGGGFTTAGSVLEDAGQLGAVATLEKPFEAHEVLAAVDDALEG